MHEQPKRCSRCEQTKPRSEFQRRKRSRDGLQSWCKDCYRQHFASREPEALKAKSASWYQRNRDRQRAYMHGRYDRETKRLWQRAWRAKNLEHARALQRRAEANRRLRGNKVSGEYAEILRGDPCSYCGGPAGQVDHIDPLALGVNGDWPNLTSACASCNSSKRSLPLLLWLAGARR